MYNLNFIISRYIHLFLKSYKISSKHETTLHFCFIFFKTLFYCNVCDDEVVWSEVGTKKVLAALALNPGSVRETVLLHWYDFGIGV